MTSFRITSRPKGDLAQLMPQASYSDWYVASTEDEARDLWRADAERYSGGQLEIVSVETSCLTLPATATHNP